MAAGSDISLFTVACHRGQVFIAQAALRFLTLSENLRSFDEWIWATAFYMTLCSFVEITWVVETCRTPADFSLQNKRHSQPNNLSYFNRITTLHFHEATIRGGVWGWQVGWPPQAPLFRGPRASSLWVCQAIFPGKLEMLIHTPFKILLQGQIP